MIRQHLMVTALAEGGAGALLLAAPRVALRALLGAGQPQLDALTVTRVGGVALLAIGVACWRSRDDRGSTAQRALLCGVLVYNAGVTIVLTHAALMLGMHGPMLWPAVALHAVFAAWGIACQRTPSRGD